MKGALGAAFVLCVLVWLVWTVSPQDQCDRVRRGAVPVGAVATVLRAGLEHWISPTERIRLLYWSLEAEKGAQDFIARQFYGAALACK